MVTPRRPFPPVNQAVTVTATVTGQMGAPTVRYRDRANAGDHHHGETSDGVDLHREAAQGAAAGQLIRYRVEATNASGTTTPRGWTTACATRAWSWRTGFTSAIPVLEWFMPTRTTT